MIGLIGPFSNFQLSFSKFGSVSADVPRLARRMALFRSDSRMTEVDDLGLEARSLV